MQNPNHKNAPGENKNLLIALLLSIIVVMGFDYFTRPSAEEIKAQQERNIAESQAQLKGQMPAKPQLDAAAADALPKMVDSSKRATIKTDKFDGSVAAKGGRLDVLTLKNHFKTVEKEENIDLFQPNGDMVQFFDAGWLSVGNVAAPDGNTVWHFANDKADINQPLTMTWDNGQGVIFQRTYILEPQTYAIRIIDGVTNESQAPVSLVHYAQVHQSGQDYTKSTFFRYFGPEGVFEKEHFTADLGDLKDSPYKGGGVTGWAGISDEYFLAAIIPDQLDQNSVSIKSTGAAGREFISLAVQSPKYTLQAGEYKEKEYRVYAGPKEFEELAQVGEDVLLTRAIDYGWFHVIAKFFFDIVMWINDKVGNLGFAIIIMTFIIKLCLFPLANKSYRAMAEMKKLQPKMQQLRERYENDREKMTLELMALYRQHKVSPASGCWPMLIQIPIFFAFYKMILVSYEFRQAPFIFWIEDMSVKDPYFVLPILMGASMYVQQLISPQAGDPIQQKVMRFLPIIFTFVFLMFPSGLVLYWVTNNIFSIAQQWYMMRKVNK